MQTEMKIVCCLALPAPASKKLTHSSTVGKLSDPNFRNLRFTDNSSKTAISFSCCLSPSPLQSSEMSRGHSGANHRDIQAIPPALRTD